MDFRTQYLQAITDEIANDPMNRGYAGKTPAQQIDLLNSEYTISVTTDVIQTPRIAVIINQIAEAPNISTTQDLKDSQVLVATPVTINPLPMI